jgi:hypothetical protein
MKHGIFEITRSGNLKLVEVIRDSKKETERIAKEYIKENDCGYFAIMKLY